MLQNIRYPGLEMTPMDYVELPSQLNERWLLDRELLDRFRAPLPDGAADAAVARRQDRAVEQVQSGIRHARVPRPPRSSTWICTRGPMESRTSRRSSSEALERVGGMPREVVHAAPPPHFDHLFGNDLYSAGYYSYLWSDVMAADAWQAFVEAGGRVGCRRQRAAAHAHSVGRQFDRSGRGIPPIPRAAIRTSQALFDARGFTTVESG